MLRPCTGWRKRLRCERWHHLRWRFAAMLIRSKRPILLENPSSYLAFAESCRTEPEFPAEITPRTGVVQTATHILYHGAAAGALIDARMF